MLCFIGCRNIFRITAEKNNTAIRLIAVEFTGNFNAVFLAEYNIQNGDIRPVIILREAFIQSFNAGESINIKFGKPSFLPEQLSGMLEMDAVVVTDRHRNHEANSLFSAYFLLFSI